MRKWFVLLALLVLLVPAPARAQTELTLESLKVTLWPEYDQPSLLVLYDFELAAGTPLPINVNIRIPRDANITAVAYAGETGMLNAEFSGPEEDGNWQVISFFVQQPALYRLEYYQPLNREGGVRSFKYKWAGDYAVNNFRLEVQIPADSTSVKTTPALPFMLESPFQSGRVSLGSLPADENYQLELQYTRTSNETVFSSESDQVDTAPLTQDTAGRVSLDNLPYYLLGVGIVLIAGAAYYFRQLNAAPAAKPRKRAHKAAAEESHIYCHECGTRALTEDRFCRVCGTKLRGT